MTAFDIPGPAPAVEITAAPSSPALPAPEPSDFARMLKADQGVEWRIFWGEMVALACMLGLALWGLAAAGVHI